MQEQTHAYLPYILESNPHPFYSFGGLKNQMRIRDLELDFGKMIEQYRTIQLFITLFIILYNILKYL
jgi:hypothetical protein